MVCPVCTHPQRDEIEAQGGRLSLRQLERQYHVSRSSLGRHVQRCQRPSRGTEAPGEPVRARASALPGNPLHRFHGEAQQLYAALADSRHPCDVRQGMAAIAALLVRMAEPTVR